MKYNENFPNWFDPEEDLCSCCHRPLKERDVIYQVEEATKADKDNKRFSQREYGKGMGWNFCGSVCLASFFE